MGRTRARAARHGGASPLTFGFFCLAATLLAAAPPAAAGVRIVSEGVTVDRAAGTARFWLRLDGPPDFRTVDELGRPLHSFQYEVDGDWSGGPDPIPFGELDAVVRGDELDADGRMPIRAAGANLQPDPDPRSGGWGPVVATVSLDLSGSELSFDAPLGALGDDDGVFAYRVFTTESGAMVSVVESHTIPLPPAAWPALATAAGWAVLAIARRRKRKRSTRTILSGLPARQLFP